jgi:hypothetical protein
MHILSLSVVLLMATACIGPFAGEKVAPWLSGPPALTVRFDSETATAHLSWPRAAASGFLRYEIQRSSGADLVEVAEIAALDDTSYVDERLDANQSYRYRVVSYFGDGDEVRELLSTVAQGVFHRFINAWDVEQGFAPTRLAISGGGTLYVVGAGSGRVERFDRAGNALGALLYTDAKLARMETSTLDGPALAIDDDDFLYIVYNVRRGKGSPQAYWSKFDPDGRLVWTRPLAGLFARHIVIDGEDIFIESISQLQLFSRNGERHAQYLIPALLVSSLHMWQGRFAALIENVSLLESDWQAPRLVVYDDVDRNRTRQVMGRDAKSPMDRGRGVLRRPTDFVVDELLDRAFVVNAGQNRIEVFRAGHFLTRWGSAGSEPGQFRFFGEMEVVEDMASGRVGVREVVAGGIGRDREGYIYVADTFNDRIQKFHP